MSWPLMGLVEEAAPPVDSNKIKIAERYLKNADVAYTVAKKIGMPYYLMCALLEKESMGKNIYGHDVGGVFSRPGEHPVTEANFKEFYRRVVINKERSNGVGPLQLTYRGFFPQLRDQGLKAWVPHDNMIFGGKLFMGYYNAARRQGHSVDESIRRAGVKYNGATPYGTRLRDIARKWRGRVGG
jgi:hypothetical protein